MSDYIGSTLSVYAGATTTEDQSSYEANSYTLVGKVVSIGEFGDTHEDLSSNLLATGRTDHSNGTKDGGEVSVTIEYSGSDAGYTIIKAGNGGTTTHTFKVTDPDGEDFYFQGVIANLRHRERTTSNKKGFSFVMRVNTAVTEVLS